MMIGAVARLDHRDARDIGRTAGIEELDDELVPGIIDELDDELVPVMTRGLRLRSRRKASLR